MIFNRIYYGNGGKREKEGIVILALEDGDQTLLPVDGEVFSSVVIKKPETLLPENIRKGITVAGITGTLIPKGAYAYAEGVKF